MASSSRPDRNLNLGHLSNLQARANSSNPPSTATSPIELPSASSTRHTLGNMAGAAGNSRLGAGSPSKEYGSSRLFSKRAREIQAQEGVSPQVWGPPPSSSGHSTPLRETIPESPSMGSFPDFEPPSADSQSTAGAGRRIRAGTMPSRFSPVGGINGLNAQPSLLPKQARQSAGPFQSGLIGTADPTMLALGALPAHTQAALLSRLRAGSTPQRSALLSNANPFGTGVFSSSWMIGRDRASTLQSIRSSEATSSPARSHRSRDSLAHIDKTLDYLGLVESPQQGRLDGMGANFPVGTQRSGMMQQPSIGDLAALDRLNRNVNRFRSYSVNAKDKYADGGGDYLDEADGYDQAFALPFTPTADITEAQALAVQEVVRQHNAEVQAFANLVSANRPRARTAGVLDSPSSRLLRNYLPTPSRLDNSISAAELHNQDVYEYNRLVDAVSSMQMDKKVSSEPLDDTTLDTPTRALWLGNIPASTTVSSLNAIFSNFGNIESTRVLTHKNCGFVNFENEQSAISARLHLNNKEIFPGAGAIRIGFARVPSASGTPGANGAYPSPSPDPFAKGQADPTSNTDGAPGASRNGVHSETAAAALVTPVLGEVKSEVVDIVKDFGASKEEQAHIGAHVDNVVSFNQYADEIPSVPEPNHNRTHDAPRLREIRKRIDNNACTPPEIESIATDMLPEIAELASDYLGNTVVQKLFEYCSEGTKEAMLEEIAPHLAEIGVHKNGTWAAQKIIDTARTSKQMHLIVDALRPYGKALFLDQYGNYVMQCCLRFGAPLNNFIFEVMLSQLWEIAQGRFGARAMRACLESHFSTKDQQRMLAAAVALHSVQLATNANGALLLTWFLDTCTFPRRRTVLAPRLIPHLVHLCTHKVAYLTVLKIINQRNEGEARDSILRALFFSPDQRTLEDILSDQTCGATLIFKVLTTPFLEEKIRPQVIENVRAVLLRLKAQPAQGYKRLMDECGLSTRHNGARDSSAGPRPGSQAGQNGHAPLNPAAQAQLQQQGNPAFGLQRTPSIESSTFGDFGYGPAQINTPSYAHSPAISAMSPMPSQQQQQQQQQQHIPYGQALMAQQAQQAASIPRPNGYYANGMPIMSGVNGYAGQGYAASGMNGSMSPMMPQMQAGIAQAQQGYNPMMVGVGVGVGGYLSQYGTPVVPGYAPQYYQAGMQQQAVAHRRGRVGTPVLQRQWQ
ncbi:hypothetical protein LTR66_007671 [Elasticomyces elasticus]|nr:hypothetical protein LTR66_007671 [Elasticomyces elasticus]